MIYDNVYPATLGADGENWNAWGKDVFTGSMDALKTFLTAKYGPDTAQQVVQNPNAAQNSDYIQQFLQWQMMQQSQQAQKSDNTLLYVALGIGAVALMMMMSNNNSRR